MTYRLTYNEITRNGYQISKNNVTSLKNKVGSTIESVYYLYFYITIKNNRQLSQKL